MFTGCPLSIHMGVNMFKKIFIFLALAFCLSVPAFAYDGSVSSINGFVNTSIVHDGDSPYALPSWYDSSEYPYYFMASNGNWTYFVASKTPAYVHYWNFNSSGEALDIRASGGVKYSRYISTRWDSFNTVDSMSVTVARKPDSNSSIDYMTLYSYNHNIVWDSNPNQVFFSIPGWTPTPVPPRPLGEVVEEMQGTQVKESLIPFLEDSLLSLVPFGIGLLASLAALAILPKVLRKFLA